MQKKDPSSSITPPKKSSSFFGPGFITGASDDDPSGIGTYTSIGAMHGFSLHWMCFVSIPFMITMQEMCGRIGLVTKKGLAQVMKLHLPRVIVVPLLILLFIANTVNITADLAAMAESLRLILGGNFTFYVIAITIFCVVLQVRMKYAQYAAVLRVFGLTLLAYIVTSFIVVGDWGPVLHSVTHPQLVFSKELMTAIVAFLGTTISGYLFFWQTSEEHEEQKKNHHLSLQAQSPGFKADIKDMRKDTISGMIFSNVITFFIMTTAAIVLHSRGLFAVSSAAEAAAMLRPLAGPFASWVFAGGIIGTGLLTIPILAGSAAYAWAELFKWNEGLELSFHKAKGFYFLIGFITVLGAVLTQLPIPPFHLLYIAAVTNGIAAPFFITAILYVSSSAQIMGVWKNSLLQNMLGTLVGVVMFAAAIVMLYTQFMP